MEELSFYDVKNKKKFSTANYQVREKGGRFLAVTKSQSGSHECCRFLSKDQAVKIKK